MSSESGSADTKFNSSAGTTAVPKDIQQVLGLEEGDRIIWEWKHGEVKVRRWAKEPPPEPKP